MTQITNTVINDRNPLGSNYLVIDQMIEYLPKLLQDCLKPFPEESHKRDVVFLSSLVTLSACFPRVKGIYDSSEIYANLYGFVIAPPASGKGVAKYGKYLATNIQAEIDITNATQKREFVSKKNETETAKREGKIVFADLQKPKSKSFLLPSNSSSAAFIKNLKINESNGNLISDSETDSLSTVLKQDWGRELSVHLRKAFHHEEIGEARKDMEEVVKIEKPKLSVFMTGTPNQIKGLFKSYQDGLLSRFCFLWFESPFKFSDVSPNESIKNLDKYYKGLSKDVLLMYNFFQTNDFTYNLSKEQWSSHNDKFSHITEECVKSYGEDSTSFTIRMAVVSYRIGMILNCLDFYAHKKSGTYIEAATDYFSMGRFIAQRLLPHSMKVLSTIKSSFREIEPENKSLFWDFLPSSFSNKEINEAAESIGCCERTARREILRLLRSKKLIRLRHGQYEKVNS